MKYMTKITLKEELRIYEKIAAQEFWRMWAIHKDIEIDEESIITAPIKFIKNLLFTSEIHKQLDRRRLGRETVHYYLELQEANGRLVSIKNGKFRKWCRTRIGRMYQDNLRNAIDDIKKNEDE